MKNILFIIAICFVMPSPFAGAELFAGAGKIFLGALYYNLCFVTLPSYPSAVPELDETVDQEIRTRIRKTWVWAAGSFLIPAVVATIAAYMTTLFSDN